MSIIRKFLGWTDKLPEKATKELLKLGESRNSFIDLSSILAVVSSQEASRKIFYKLTELAAKEKKALLAPKIVMTDYVLSGGGQDKRVISKLERKIILIDILRHLDISKFDNLFPVLPADQEDITWASKNAELIIELIKKLTENGSTISDIYKNHGDFLSGENEKWKDLSIIEELYIEKLSALGLKDPDHIKIESSKNPHIPKGISKLILIGVLDPMRIVFNAVKKISEFIDTEIWIYASEEYSKYFDLYGRPEVEFWSKNHLEMQNSLECIYQESLPSQQAERTVNIIENIAHKKSDLTMDDITVFAVDSDLIPYLKKSFDCAEIESFDPSGIFLNNSSLFSLIKRLLDFTIMRDYRTFAELLRNADFLRYLKTVIDNFNIEQVLKSLDLFQNKYKLIMCEDMIEFLEREEKNHTKGKIDCYCVHDALVKTMELCELTEKGSFRDFLVDTINLIYSSCNFTQSSDHNFIKSAEKLNLILEEFNNSRTNSCLSFKEYVYLFYDRIQNEKFYPDLSENMLQIQGYLESLWTESSYLIFNGMNDRFIPTRDAKNPFLPEVLKERLKFRCNSTNFARDSYILFSLLQTRKGVSNNGIGFVNFILGKWDVKGNPLNPSIFFYLCDDEKLLTRMNQFFKDESYLQKDGLEVGTNLKENVSFKLKIPYKEAGEKISVSSFKDYLRSPLIFYLKYVLGMKNVDDSSDDLDASEMGTICHKAFEKLTSNIKKDFSEETTIHPDINYIVDILVNAAQRYVKTRYGNELSLSLFIVLESIKSRLIKAAEIYLEDYKEGWRTLYTEYKLPEFKITEKLLKDWLKDSNVVLNRNYFIVGRIDKIDINKHTGDIRVIDYKTSDSEHTPSSAHFSAVLKIENYIDTDFALFEIDGKNYRWLDFQLLLYYIILKSTEEFKNKRIMCSYFNLPSSLDKIGISDWNISNRTKDISEYVDKAKMSIGKIITRIDQGKFAVAKRNISSYDFEEFKRIFINDLDKYLDYTEIQ